MDRGEGGRGRQMGDKYSHYRPSNEGKTCDAVINVLEQRTGQTRADIRLPEKDGWGPPVELRLKLGTQEYAIEHTQIEAFERQIATGVSLEEFIEPVNRELAGVLPGPALYEIIFPVDPSLGLKKSGLKQIQKNLIEWVHENARLLHGKIHERVRGKTTGELARRDLIEHIKKKLPSFPYEIALNCSINRPFSEQEPGILGAKRWAPDDKDLESYRAKRLLQALSRKSPKLQRCKQEGARTVLVLESEDIAFTSYNLVGLALDDLREEFTKELQFPDEIYFVETYTDSWIVWPMKYDFEYRPVEDWPKWNPSKFHVDDLIDLTK